MAWTYGESAAIYQYDTFMLEDNIRILEIVESDVTSDISLSMRCYPRMLAPPYVAISYTWGDEPASHEILIDGKIFYIRPNLWHCLVHITREEEAKNSWRNLWIDAICINQNDIAEKNEQVGSMHLTFQNATICIAWLGLYPGTEPIHHPEQRDAASESQSILPDRHVRRELFLQPYFHRIWIVQELIVSRKVLYLWGSRRIGWVDFIAALQTFLIQMDGNVLEARLLLNGWFSDIWRPLATLGLTRNREKKAISSWRRPLGTMLRDLQKSACSEPRDRVFGVLNILPTHERQVLGVFFPDYSLSLERVQLITLAFLRLQSSSLRKEHSENLKALLLMLHIESEDLHSELAEKSRPDQAVEHRAIFESFERMRSPARWVHDDCAVDRRVDALRFIASKRLSKESDEHAAQVQQKSWYVRPSEVATADGPSPPQRNAFQRVVKNSRGFYEQGLKRWTV